MVLNMGPVDWEPSTLTTNWGIPEKYPNRDGGEVEDILFGEKKNLEFLGLLLHP